MSVQKHLEKCFASNHFIHFTGSTIIMKICCASLNSQYSAHKAWSYPALTIKTLVCHIYFVKIEF